MNFRVLLAVPVLLLAGAAGADTAGPRHAGPDDMELSVADAFDRATTVIQGLADMCTPAQPYDVGHADGAGEARHRRRQSEGTAKAIRPLAAPAPVWRGRHIGPMERSTVFAMFQVTVDETSPNSFDVTVISSGFCEEVDVKDRGTQKMLATESLDDEKLFKVSVSGHALDQNVELSIGVLDPDDPDSLHFAAVPILDGTGLLLSR